MVKTNVPSEFQFGNNTIATNALPDPFDALDLQYRPKLQMLPPVLDGRAGKVLDQKGQSCTGHAVAALIDTVNSLPTRKGAAERPAPTPDDQAQLSVHALRTCPQVRRVSRQRRRRVVASRRAQGLVPPRRLHGEDLGLHHLPRTRPRRPRLHRRMHEDAARRLLPGQRPPARRHAIGADGAQRACGIGRGPRGLANARPRDAPRPADLGHPPPRGPRARAAGRPRVPARRLQRRRLPRPELVGHDVGPQGLRDAALRRLARQRVRRVGRPARRSAGRHRLATATGHSGGRRASSSAPAWTWFGSSRTWST